MDAVSTIDQRVDERGTWLAALALGTFAVHSVLFVLFPAGDVIMFVVPWYEHILAEGRVGAFAHPFSNYTPPYLYLLSATTLLDGLIPAQYLVKLLSYVGAIWLVFAGYRLLQALGARPVLALAMLLLPSIIANVPMLGQADTFWVAPCLLALAAAVKRRWFWVAFWSGLAFSFKAQAAFFAPFVLHLFITRKVPVRFWLVAPAVSVAAMLPAWLAGWPAWDLATIYLRQATWQPDKPPFYFISNGASWWTLYGWLLPQLALKTFWVGFALAIAAVIAMLAFVPRLSGRKMVLLATISAAGIPFLLPGMHERFYLLADVLAFIYAIAFPSRRSIAAAIIMQIASALPVYVWAFEIEPLQLMAPPLAAVALFLFLKELAEPVDEPHPSEHFVRSHAPAWLRFLPFATLALVIALLTRLSPTNDAAWQIWVGRQMLGGAQLYRDIIEINPPLWFWIGAPISPFGWPGLMIFFGLSAALSIALARRLYLFWWLPYALIFAFFLTGISATGQREQFTLIAVTPYILLTAARAERRQVSLRFAITVGLWAALGFALKHYFALVPLALQAWLLLKRRSIAPEFIVVCLAGAAYVVSVLIFAPAYLTEIVPLVREAYSFYDQKVGWFLTTEVVLISGLAVVGLCIAGQKDALVQALAISAAVFLAIYVGQLKGFRYQGVPALGLISLMAFSLLFRLDLSSFRNKAACAILVFVPIFTLIGSVVLPPRSQIAGYVCTLPRGTKILALAVNGGIVWPAVETCHLEWSSRQMILWTLASPKLKRFTRDEILRGLATRPDVVVIDKKPVHASPYRFVMSQRSILSALEPYRVVDENQRFVVLELRSATSGPQ